MICTRDFAHFPRAGEREKRVAFDILNRQSDQRLTARVRGESIKFPFASQSGGKEN